MTQQKKNTLLITAITLIILFTPGAFAITPEQIGDFEIDLPVGAILSTTNNDGQYALWDNYAAVVYAFSGSNRAVGFDIYNIISGELVYRSATFNTCDSIAVNTATASIAYADGYLFIGHSRPTTSDCTNNRRVTVYDVSNIAFINQIDTFSQATGIAGTVTEPIKIIDEEGVNKTLIHQNFLFLFNGTGTSFVSSIASPYGSRTIKSIDLDNEVIGINNNFYDISSSVSSPTLIDSVESGRGNLKDWNRNENNPEYISEQGFFVLTGGADYDDIRTSSINIWLKH